MAPWLLAVWLWAGPAHARADDAQEVVLHWSAPQECPDEGVVRRSIESLLGRDMAPSANDDTMVADARVETSNAGVYAVQLTIRLGELEGRRELEDADCGQLAQATAFIVAVAADPSVMDKPVPPPPEEDALPAHNPALDPIVKLRKRRRVGGAVGAAAAGGIGALPGVGPGVRGFAALRISGWSIEGFGSYWFARSTTIHGSHEQAGPLHATGELSIAAGGLLGCHNFSHRRLEIPVCAGLEAGSLRVRNADLEIPPREDAIVRSTTREFATLWLALDAAVGVTVLLTEHIGFWTRVEAAVPFNQYDIQWENLDLAFEVGPASLRLFAGIEGRFGAR